MHESSVFRLIMACGYDTLITDDYTPYRKAEVSLIMMQYPYMTDNIGWML